MTSKTYALSDIEAKAAELQQNGIIINPESTSGDIKSHGCEFTYSISDGNITVNLVHKPWELTDNFVWRKMDDFFGDN